MDAAAIAVGTARWWVSAALYVTAGALLGWCVFFGGGSGSAGLARLGTAASIVAGLALVAASAGLLSLPRLDRAGASALIAAVLLVAWGGLSIWWSIAGDRSWDALRKGLVYAAFGVIGLALAGLGARSARSLAFVVSGVLGAALAWALVGKAIPALGPDDALRVARLKGAVGYWNALALLAGAAIPLGLWLMAEVRGRVARPAGALLVAAASLVVLLTQSRAGLVAALAVTALWLSLSSDPVEGALLALLAGIPGIAVAGWAFTRTALVEDGAARADRVADGAALGVVMVVAGLVAVALVLTVPVARLVATHRREVARALVGGAALLAVVGAIGLVAAVGNPFSWAGDQIGRSGEVTNDPSRFRSLNTNNRTEWWGEAWQIFRAHPASGTGARTFEIARKRYRENAATVSEPHSVPMQLLADTGLPGFALGAVVVVFLGLGLRATFRRLDGAERAAAAALVGLPAAYAIHALVDYDLDFAAVTAPTVLVAAALLGVARPATRMPRGILVGLGIAAATAAAVYAIVVPSLATRQVDAAYRQLDERSFARAAASARRAQGLNPLSPEPLWARADVADAVRDPAAAEAFYEQATRLQPDNPATWYALGVFRQAGLDDQCGAYQALNAAYTLDPKSSLWTQTGPLVIALAAVNAGACEKQ